MKTGIYIISGFLGTRKTALIDRLLQEVFDPREIVVTGSDFDEVSLDTLLIRSGGFAVKGLSAECICCNLTGDFQATILEVLREFSPRQILIEPSGARRLSDVESACHPAKIVDTAQIRRKIIVTDIVCCRMYLDNFGESCENQIRHADVILLSHTEQNPDKVSHTKTLLTAMAPKAQLLAGAWESLDPSTLLGGSAAHAADCHEEDCYHGHPHKHHYHDEECNHDHSTHETFDTVTLSLSRTVARQELEAAFRTAEADRPGNILRVKDVVSTPKGPVMVRHLPGGLNLTPCTLQPGSLCLIGNNLHEQEFKRIFEKE